MNWLLVIVGAAVGAPLRYLADRAVQARHDTLFPWGTFLVNVTGCLLLGLLTGAASAGHASGHVQLLVGTGLCGALTHLFDVLLRDPAADRDGGRPLRRRQRRRQCRGGPRRGVRRGRARAGGVDVGTVRGRA